MTNPSDATEVARRANDLFGSVPFEDLRDAVLSTDLYEAAIPRFDELGLGDLENLIDSSIEVEVGDFAGGAALAGGGGRGYDAWLGFWREWLEPWEELVFEPLSYERVGERGDHALVEARVTARGRQSGVPAELSVWQLWGVRDGRVTHYAVHPTRDGAIAAVKAREAGGKR
jgi:SnoaL-like domain